MRSKPKFNSIYFRNHSLMSYSGDYVSVYLAITFVILDTLNIFLIDWLINTALSDDQDIMKQTRSLYARANVIIRKFSHASLNTKLMLFRAYCSPIYGCQLWSTVFQYSYCKLRVAYNDAFRQLLQEPRWCSASRLFVFHNVSSFSAIIRKLVYSLLFSSW